MSAIHTFEDIQHRDRERAYLAYLAAPEFPEVEAQARARGFRHATLAEVHASAEDPTGLKDGLELYCYRGGLWVRLEAHNG